MVLGSRSNPKCIYLCNYPYNIGESSLLESVQHRSGINLSMCIYIYIPYECLSLTEINQFFKHLKDYTTHGNTHTPKSGIPSRPTSSLGDYWHWITHWTYWLNDHDNSFNNFSFIHLAHLRTDKHCCCCCCCCGGGGSILLWVVVCKKNKKMWENKEE